MDSNKRIALINAYQQLQGISLKLNKSTPEDTAKTVQDEFQSFIQNRIDELLNGKKSIENNSQFSPEDLEVLRALINGVREKQRGGTQPGRPTTKKSYDQPETGLRTNTSNARPMVDPDPDGLKVRNLQIDMLKSLERMNNEGPEY